jgi:hypothetical protein
MISFLPEDEEVYGQSETLFPSLTGYLPGAATHIR